MIQNLQKKVDQVTTLQLPELKGPPAPGQKKAAPAPPQKHYYRGSVRICKTFRGDSSRYGIRLCIDLHWTKTTMVITAFHRATESSSGS